MNISYPHSTITGKVVMVMDKWIDIGSALCPDVQIKHYTVFILVTF